MEVMVENCCGIDVHQKSIQCCILSGPLDSNKPKKLSRNFKTSTKDLSNALSWLIENKVTDVFFESTGQYWIPVYNIFADSDINLVLANPQHIKNVPGRKTDIRDAEWIAQLGRCGLIAPSYIPVEEVMQLRLLTRRKKSYKEKSTQCKNEIHNILQRANIKLTSIVADIFGKSDRKLLELFINGEVIEVKSVSKCMHGKMRATPHEVVEALDGKLSIYDAWLLRESFEELTFYEEKIKRISKEIDNYIEIHFKEMDEMLQSIPGVSKDVSAVVLGEIGPNIEAFKTAGHLTSWAGLSPGSYESAGKSKSSHITPGNKYLKSALVIAGV